MKIRSDFVTNSSSSSFVAIKLNSNTLGRILNNFQEAIDEMIEKGEFYGSISIYGSSVRLSMDEAYYSGNIDSILDVLNAFIYMFVGYRDKLEISKNESINEKMDLSKFKAETASNGSKLAAEIFDFRKDILKDITFAEISLGDCGWGGDSESRYYESNYSKEKLEEIYEAIAEENGCDVSEVTDEDFGDYVGDKVGIEEITYSFVKKNDTVIKNIDKDFYLE